MEVLNRANLIESDFAEIRSQLQEHHSLPDLLRWAQGQPQGALLPGVIADLVVQDEFTHDLVVPWRGFFIIYGTT